MNPQSKEQAARIGQADRVSWMNSMRARACLVLLLLGLSIPVISAQPLSNAWSKIAGGAGASSNGLLTISGTIGQHDAINLANDSLLVAGGYWGVARSQALAPSLTACPADQSLCTTNLAGAVATFLAPTALDAYEGVVAVTCTPASGSLFAIGTNTVLCSATDTAGNSNGCAFRVLVTLDRPPVLDGLTLATRSNRPVTAEMGKITARLLDPDGDPVTLTGVSGTSLNGGTVTTTATSLTYTPPAGFAGVDTITMAFSDGRCWTATGLLVVTVDDGTGVSLNLVSIRAVPGGVDLRFAGIPGYAYVIERAPAPTGPWSQLANVTAPSHGIMIFIDGNPPPGMGFYRTVAPP